MALSTIISNIQVLYVTSYELLNIEVLLGTVVFCSSFLVCDIINIEYGSTKAKQAIYFTIVTDLFFLISILLTLGHTPLDYSQYPNFSISQKTFELNVFSIQHLFLPLPRLLIASYFSYFVSQLSEIWLYNFLKKTNFIRSQYLKHNVALFISSILIDTFIFTLLGLCLMAPESLKANDYFSIWGSAILVRFLCNLGNSMFAKISIIKEKL